MTSRILALLFLLATLARGVTALSNGDAAKADGEFSYPPLRAGNAYTYSLSGSFGGGTATIGYLNAAGAFTSLGKTFTAAGSVTKILPESATAGQGTPALSLTGATSPALVLTLTQTPAGTAVVDNAAVVSAIEENPSAIQTAVSTDPAVWVTFASGARIPYKPSANTDAARGDALSAAWTAALAATGAETIDLYPATFDCARATSTVISVATQFAVEAGMTVRFNGAKVTHGSSFNGAVIFGADAVDGWSFLGPGILEGTAATSSGTNEVGINTRTSRRWLIRDLTVRYFRNTGIQANSSSYTSGDYSSGKVSTGRIIGCNIDLNNIGFGNYAGSEYISLTACTLNKNLTAADIYAGNTRFLACEATYNTNYAIRIRDGGNDGHGIWNGGSINHNSGFAVAVEANMDNGFTFTGAHLYADSATTNKIQSLGGGLTFSGCIIDSPFYASATPSGLNTVIGSHFPVSVVSAANAVTDLSYAERLKWAFLQNHSLTGGYANNDTIIYRFAGDAAAATGGLTAGRQYTDSDTNAVSIKQ